MHTEELSGDDQTTGFDSIAFDNTQQQSQLNMQTTSTDVTMAEDFTNQAECCQGELYLRQDDVNSQTNAAKNSQTSTSFGANRALFVDE